MSIISKLTILTIEGIELKYKGSFECIILKKMEPN